MESFAPELIARMSALVGSTHDARQKARHARDAAQSLHGVRWRELYRAWWVVTQRLVPPATPGKLAAGDRVRWPGLPGAEDGSAIVTRLYEAAGQAGARIVFVEYRLVQARPTAGGHLKTGGETLAARMVPEWLWPETLLDEPEGGGTTGAGIQARLPATEYVLGKLPLKRVR